MKFAFRPKKNWYLYKQESAYNRNNSYINDNANYNHDKKYYPLDQLSWQKIINKEDEYETVFSIWPYNGPQAKGELSFSTYTVAMVTLKHSMSKKPISFSLNKKSSHLKLQSFSYNLSHQPNNVIAIFSGKFYKNLFCRGNCD